MKAINIYSELKTQTGIPRKVQFARLEKIPSGYFMRLKGFRFGRFAGLPLDDSEEYIKGNLIFEGNIGINGERVTVDCGFIYTESNQQGHIYIGHLLCDPWPTALCMKLSDEGLLRYGIVLRVVDN